MSRINLDIIATGNFSNVTNEINILKQKVISLNSQIAQTGISDKQVSTITKAAKEYDNLMKSSGAYHRTMVDVQDATAKFGNDLQAGKLQVGQYFKVWREGSRQTAGDLRKLAEQQVALQKSVIRTDAFQPGRVFVDTPKQIDAMSNKTAIARKQLEMYNLSLYKGGDALINWGKNTQWAGRQLTVGLTVPIAIFGQKAAQAFMSLDKELVRVTKVYGTGITQVSDSVLASIRSQVSNLATQLAQQLGVPIAETAATAADIAAIGLQGNDLLSATTQATRLSVLGEIDRQTAVKATISLQNVFKLNTGQLADSINFLNSVENATSTSLGDLVAAIPKASPIVAQLGGSFKDVAVMMVAMKEAGIPAGEAANAIKSSVASLINPTDKVTVSLGKMGINLKEMVAQNSGNIPALFKELQVSLSKLDSLQRAQVIEKIFGKYQFARVSALLQNIGKEGSQTQRVFELMAASSATNAGIADKELKQVTESTSGRYNRAVQSFQAAIVPFGEMFTKFATKGLELFTNVANFINSNPMLKNILGMSAGFIALVGPVVMLGGVFANFFGYLIKAGASIKNVLNGFGKFGKVVTPETIAAAKAGDIFQQSLANQAETTKVLEKALMALNAQLIKYETLASRASHTGSTPFVDKPEAPQVRPRSQSNFDPHYDPKNGGQGMETYHTNSFTKLKDETRLYLTSVQKRTTEQDTLLNDIIKATTPGTEGDTIRKRLRGYERINPPSSTVGIEGSIPATIQRGAKDAPQHYYEPSPQEIKNMGIVGIDAKLLENARNDWIKNLAQGNAAVEKKLLDEAKNLSTQDIKDWTNTGQIQSKVTAKILQDHLHEVLVNDKSNNKVVAKELSSHIQKALYVGSPVELQHLVNTLNLQEKIDNLTSDIMKSHTQNIKTGIEAVKVLPEAEQAAALSRLFEQEAIKVNATLEQNYHQQVADFYAHKVGHNNMIKVVSAVSRKGNDVEFSGFAAVEQDLNSSLQKLFQVAEEEGTLLAEKINQAAAAIRSSVNIDAGTVDENGIKSALQQLEINLKELGFIAEEDIISMSNLIRSVSPQLAGISSGTQFGSAIKSAAARPLKMKATGGSVYGPGGPKEDKVPAMLSNGEYVIQADAVSKYGVGFFNSLNAKKFADGGMVEHYAQGGQKRQRRNTRDVNLPPLSKSGIDPLASAAVKLETAAESLITAAQTTETAAQTTEAAATSLEASGGAGGGVGGPAGEGKKSIGSKLKGAFGMGSMGGFALSMGLGAAGTALSAVDNKAAQAAASVAQFAAMGAMFGPWGIAIGAVAGGLMALKNHFDEISRINTNSLNASLQIGDIAAAHFKITIKDLANVQLTALVGKTKKAVTELDQLAQAYSQAGDQLTKDFLQKIKDADPAEATKLLANKYTSDIIAGLTDEAARIDISAILKAAGKSDLAFGVKIALDKFSFKDAGSALESQLSDLVNKIPKISTEQTATRANVQYTTGGEILPPAIPEDIKAQWDAVGVSINNALSTMPVEEFVNSTRAVFPLVEQASVGYAKFGGILNAIGKDNPELAKSMQEAADSGAGYKNTLDAAAVALAGLISTNAEFQRAASDPVYIDLVIRESHISTFVDTATTGVKSSLNAVRRPGAARSTSGGGGSGTNDATNAKYDKLTKIQDKIIERNRAIIDGLNKEREARQKLYDLQQNALQNDVTKLNLENEISKAIAVGDLGKAAALQAELKAQKSKESADARETATKAREDAKIAAANARIAAAEAQKQKISDAKSKATKSSGGGSTSSPTPSTPTVSPNALIDSIGQMVTDKGFASFKDMWNDKGIQEYVKQLKNIGYTEKQVYDSLVTDYSGTELWDNQKIAVQDMEKEISKIPGKTQETILQIEESIKNGDLTVPLVTKLLASPGISVDSYGNIKIPKPTTLDQEVYTKLSNSKDIIKYPDGSWTLRKPIPNSVDLKINAVVMTLNGTKISQNKVNSAAMRAMFHFTPLTPAHGGHITGPGTKTSDSIPSMLSNGEYVIKADAVSKYGVGMFDKMNTMKFANGGMASKYATSNYNMGGDVKYSSGGQVSSNSVYTYNVNVNVSNPNASADDIANKVLGALKRRDNMNRTVTTI